MLHNCNVDNKLYQKAMQTIIFIYDANIFVQICLIYYYISKHRDK